MYKGLEISQQSYERIADKFEEIFDDEDIIVNALAEEQGTMMDYLADEQIRMAGFPKDANHQNVKHKYRIKNKIDIELWVEMFVNMYDLEGETDFGVETDAVLGIILENFESVDLSLEIQEDFETWKAENKQIGISKKEIVEEMYASLASDAKERFVNYMKENYAHEIREDVQEELVIDGYKPEKINELVSIADGDSRDGYLLLPESTSNIEGVVADLAYQKLLDGKYTDIDQYLESDEFLEDAKKCGGLFIEVELRIEDAPYEDEEL
ncbi:hypothetical protein BUY35_00405 [Staphylococcus cohnii]|nr:hypothetical protein BUY35_00405 [Staphylococcus cohnii]